MSSHALRAILFSDIVGFSGKMAADEAETMAMVRRNAERHRRWVPEYGGTVVDSMGDGFLCVFDSCRQAVQAGLAIQQDLAASQENTELRVGVHVGDVLLEQRRGKLVDVFGDAVNIAARIESNAPSPGVWVSARAASDLRNLQGFELTSAGAFTLKNIPEPMELFQVNSTINYIEPAQIDDRRPRFRPFLMLLAFLFSVVALAAVGSVVLNSTEEAEMLAVLPPVYSAADDSLDHLPSLIQGSLIDGLIQQGVVQVLSQASAQKLMGSSELIRNAEIDFFIEGSLTVAEEALFLTLRIVEADSESLLYSLSDQSPATLVVDEMLPRVQRDIAQFIEGYFGR